MLIIIMAHINHICSYITKISTFSSSPMFVSTFHAACTSALQWEMANLLYSSTIIRMSSSVIARTPPTVATIQTNASGNHILFSVVDKAKQFEPSCSTIDNEMGNGISPISSIHEMSTIWITYTWCELKVSYRMLTFLRMCCLIRTCDTLISHQITVDLYYNILIQEIVLWSVRNSHCSEWKGHGILTDWRYHNCNKFLLIVEYFIKYIAIHNHCWR